MLPLRLSICLVLPGLLIYTASAADGAPASSIKTEPANRPQAPSAPAKVSTPVAANPKPSLNQATARHPAKTAAAPAPKSNLMKRLLATPPHVVFWPASKAPSQWKLSAGFVWRNLGKLEFNSYSNGIASGAPFVVPNSSFALGATGSGSGFGDRTYSDGFVNVDQGTSITGDTSFWGYSSADQISGSTISFHGSGPSWTTISQDLTLDASPGWDERLASGGPIVTLSFEKEWSKNLTLGLDLSASLLGIDTTNDSSSFLSVISMNHFSSRVTDSYSSGGVPFPPAPHTGHAGIPGPLLLSNVSRAQKSNLDSIDKLYVFDRIEEHLDLTLTTVSLGPTIAYNHGPWLAHFGYGLALNVASWDASKHDVVYSGNTLASAKPIAEWHDAESGTDVLPGFYLQSSIGYEIDKRWSLSLFGRYDWSRKLKGEVGGSTFSLDLSGWSTGVMATYRF